MFSACYHWWICLLVLLFSSFLPLIISFILIIKNKFLIYYYFFLSFFFISLFFWAMWLTGSWCSGLVSGLSLWGGRAKFRTLDHQRLSTPGNINRWELSQRPPPQCEDLAPPNSQQTPVLNVPCQTTSKTGTKHHPLTERLPKIILSSQTPINTPLDVTLPTRKTRSSPTHQNTGISPLHQEACTSHWTNLTTGGRHQKQWDLWT